MEVGEERIAPSNIILRNETGLCRNDVFREKSPRYLL